MSKAVSLPENVARTVLKDCWDGFLPVDINALADRLGVAVVYSEKLPDNISGSYKQSGGEHICTINAKLSTVYQRFTLAHELGHYALIHGDCSDGEEIFHRQEDGISPFEIEANTFAEEILMPAGVVRRLIMEENITDPEMLARRFNVSTRMMVIRLINLRWIK